MKKFNRLPKPIRSILIIGFSIILLFFLTSFIAQKWLEYNLKDMINKKPDRAYDINYEDLDLNLFFKGFKLESASIIPLNEGQGTSITGKVALVEINGFSWMNLLMGKSVSISEMTFFQPEFELTFGAPDSVEEAPSKKVQQLFGDILSRAKLNKFRILHGSFSVKKKGEQLIEIGQVGNFNLEANDIETDSLQWKYPIPFKLGEITSHVEDIIVNLDDHTTFSCRSFDYHPQHSRISFNNISLKLNKDWVEVSNLMGEQKDIIELDLKSLILNGIGAKSKLYGDFDIRTESIVIDSLVLNDNRNKNQSRPPDTEKPMFSNMVASIPIGLRVDTIIIKNTFITYSELNEGKTIQGGIHLDNMNGSIYNVTTLDTFKTIYKQFNAELYGQLNQSGRLSINLTVPYDLNEFHLNARIDSIDLMALNSTIQPMAGIEAKSGFISNLELDMKATRTYAVNHMIMNYTDLVLSVMKTKEEEIKKMGLISSIANSMVRNQNMPGDKKYIIANYRTQRNIYRSPFNYMWLSVKDGLMQIALSKTAKKLIGPGKDNKEKKKTK